LPGGLRARIRHHLESVAQPHWHIDYYKAKLEWLLPILLHLVNTERLLKLPYDKFGLPAPHMSKLRLVGA